MAMQVKVGGEVRTFRSNGEVAGIVDGAEVALGKWRSTDNSRDNRIRYTIQNAEQEPLAAVYRFNSDKQLEMQLRGADGAESVFEALVGGVEIDDNHDIAYRIVDENETELNRVMIYGDITFEEGSNALVIRRMDGGEVRLEGDSGAASLEAAQNREAGFKADDLLRFHVTTTNTLADGSLLQILGKIEMVGSWDIENGSLVFLSRIKGDIAKPEIKLGFAGKIGAVTGGFVYFADSTGTSLAFEIRGEHRFKAGDSDATFDWESRLGYSDKKFDSRIKGDLRLMSQEGRKLTLGGTLELKKAQDEPMEMSLEVSARYEWDNNELSFKAEFTRDGEQTAYDLMLEGNFTLDHARLQFSIRYSNDPANPGLALALSVQGDRDSFLQAVSLKLNLQEAEITADIAIRMRFVKGVGRVYELKAKDAAA